MKRGAACLRGRVRFASSPCSRFFQGALCWTADLGAVPMTVRIHEGGRSVASTFEATCWRVFLANAERRPFGGSLIQQTFRRSPGPSMGSRRFSGNCLCPRSTTGDNSFRNPRGHEQRCAGSASGTSTLLQGNTLEDDSNCVISGPRGRYGR